MRERDDDAVAGAHEPGELVLGLGEPAGRDRGPLGLELERLAARERVELGRCLERQLHEPLVRPDGPHVVGLPDDVGGRASGATRSSGPSGAVVLALERDARVDEIARRSRAG